LNAIFAVGQLYRFTAVGGIMKICGAPSRPEMNASRLPSGDQRGEDSDFVEFVYCRSSRVVTSIIQMWVVRLLPFGGSVTAIAILLTVRRKANVGYIATADGLLWCQLPNDMAAENTNAAMRAFSRKASYDRTPCDNDLCAAL